MLEDDKENRTPSYLTDEQLEKLMQSLEQQELYAPAHLKESVFDKLHENQKKAKRQKEISFGMYTFRMVAGMAAAILVLFLVPIENVEKTTSKIEERWTKTNEALDDFGAIVRGETFDLEVILKERNK